MVVGKTNISIATGFIWKTLDWSVLDGLFIFIFYF